MKENRSLHLHYSIKIPEFDHEISLEDTGTIEYLSLKYGFTIIGPHEWDFAGFIGRKCHVLRNERGFRFVSFVNVTK